MKIPFKSRFNRSDAMSNSRISIDNRMCAEKGAKSTERMGRLPSVYRTSSRVPPNPKHIGLTIKIANKTKRIFGTLICYLQIKIVEFFEFNSKTFSFTIRIIKWK